MKKLTTGCVVLLLSASAAINAQAQAEDDSSYLAGNQNRLWVSCGIHSLQKAVDRVAEGGWIVVRDTCREAIVIRKDRIRIAAADGATIIPPDGSAAFTVLADGVEISGFHIVGGTSGVEISAGSSARVENNQILDSTDVGIFLNGGSYAHVSGNLLNSTSGNISQIFSAGNSHADVIGNTITASSGTGIAVVAASSAQVSDNDVSGTAAVALLMGANSHMRLLTPNTVSNPAGAALFCSPSGSLMVETEQDMTAPVVINPTCHLSVAGGVIFP